MNTINNLTEIEKIAIDWQYDRLGGFYKTLMKAISLADEDNLKRLALSFPYHTTAYLKYSNENDWWKKTQEKAYKLGLIAGRD